jgi:membrane-bound serine protease (ClpP class)
VRDHRARRWSISLLAGVIAWCWVSAVSRADPGGDARPASFLHLKLSGVINPPKARWVASTIERAEREGERFVLISLDTPGGLVASMQEICGAIANSKVPVVGFVEPKGAQATSAGAFILLATDVAAMSPGTRIGAAHPVGSGEKLDQVMDEKATNSLSSLARSLATRRWRPPDWAESMVRESRSFTEQEALNAGGIEIIATDLDALLSRLDGYRIAPPGELTAGADRTAKAAPSIATKGVIRVPVTLPWHWRVLDVLADPTLAALLLSLGVMAVLYELSSPGIGMGGIVGVICIVLGLLGASVLPLELGGVVLAVVGLIAIGVEIKAQTHGMLAAGGIVALVLGAMALVDPNEYFGVVQRVDWRLFAPTITVLVVLLVILGRVARNALAAAPQLGVEAMAGRPGRAKENFAQIDGSFRGTVFVDGARWEGVSTTAIADGDEIEVKNVLHSPTRLEVVPARQRS